MSRTTATQGAALAPLAIGFLFADGAAASAKAALPAIQPVDSLPARAMGTAIERGKAELRAGRPADAVAAFREALAADPQSVDALSGMAVAYDQLGRHDLSRPLYEAALILDPRSPVLLYNYGLSLHLQRDRAGALRFLGLAAAGGDAEVESAALGLIARLDPQRQAPPGRLAAAPGPEAAHAMAAQPALPPAPAPTAKAAALTSGPALVRTSEHEVRLVLRPDAVAPAPLVAELGGDALAMLPVAGLSAREDAAILAREEASLAAEALALARSQAEARQSADLAALAPALREALAVAAGMPRPGHDVAAPLLAAATPPARPPSVAPATAIGPMAEGAVTPATPATRLEVQQLLALALAQPALQQQRRSPPARDANLLPPAEPQPKPRRAFEASFDSDDARLNSFARRIQAGDAGVAVARLQALVDRLQAA